MKLTNTKEVMVLLLVLSLSLISCDAVSVTESPTDSVTETSTHVVINTPTETVVPVETGTPTETPTQPPILDTPTPIITITPTFEGSNYGYIGAIMLTTGVNLRDCTVPIRQGRELWTFSVTSSCTSRGVVPAGTANRIFDWQMDINEIGFACLHPDCELVIAVYNDGYNYANYYYTTDLEGIMEGQYRAVSICGHVAGWRCFDEE